MGNMYGYGSITSNEDLFNLYRMKNVKNTTAYKSLRSMFLPEENIIIDFIPKLDADRPKLRELVETLQPDDVIVIYSLKSLGTKKSILKWYEYIANNNIGLLIPDSSNKKTGLSRFSTADWAGEIDKNKISSLNDLINELKYLNSEMQYSVGRIKKEIDDKFIQSYWAWQNYYITTEQALGSSNLSRQRFYALTKEYEATEDYLKELQRQPQDFVNKPKRGSLPQIFRKILFEVENLGTPLQNVCEKHSISIPDIEYERMKTTYLYGKKAMAEAQRRYLYTQNTPPYSIT